MTDSAAVAAAIQGRMNRWTVRTKVAPEADICRCNIWPLEGAFGGISIPSTRCNRRSGKLRKSALAVEALSPLSPLHCLRRHYLCPAGSAKYENPPSPSIPQLAYAGCHYAAWPTLLGLRCLYFVISRSSKLHRACEA